MTVKNTAAYIRFRRRMLNTKAPSDQLTYLVKGLARSRTGFPNPKWRQKIANVENASTTFTAYRQDLWNKPISQYLTWEEQFPPGAPWTVFRCSTEGYSGQHIPKVLSGHQVSGPSEAQADAQAIKALYQRLRSIHSQTEGGVILGEARKTLEMIAKPAQALRKGVVTYLRDIKKIISKGPRWVVSDPARFGHFYKTVTNKKAAATWQNTLKEAIAGTYLEATYGWQPLLSDVRDSAIALARMRNDYPHTEFHVIGSASKEYPQGAVDFMENSLAWHSQVIVSEKVSVVYYGAFQEKAVDYMSSPSLQKVIDLSGFSLKNFVPTMWELIPYSFLVDYFVNIGDLLAAATTDTSSVKWITRVLLRDTVETHHVIPFISETLRVAKTFPGGRNHAAYGSSGEYQTRYKSVSRNPLLGGLPIPQLRFDVPDLWSRHMLNVAALLAGSRSDRRFVNAMR